MSKVKIKKDLDLKSDECSICLERLLQPCKLQCGHIFCFLCIKGSILQKSECALCRSEIKSNYLIKPNLIKASTSNDFNTGLESSKYAWFYKGYKGWWQYDERTNANLELEYEKKTKKFETLIAGRLYTIDLENYVQIRSDNSSFKRTIKRDSISSSISPIKGVAGIHKSSRKLKK